MANLRQLWQASLLFRRIATLVAVAALALLVSFASHIKRSVPLPDDDLNKLAVARIGDERLILESPHLAEGDLALSYVGNKNEVAALWLEDATLAPQSMALFGGNAAVLNPGPQRISYTTGADLATVKPGDTCHTSVEIRRATGSAPIAAMLLYQTDETAGAQRFRQLVLDAGNSTLDLLVHTDSPVEGESDFAGCHKVLTVGEGQPLDLPLLPVHMVVHGGKVDLYFNPGNPAVPIWTGENGTFEAVSLGSGALQVGRLEVVAAARPVPARLDVVPAKGTSTVTIKDLKLGSDHLDINVGRDGETALAYANGKSIQNYDLIATVQKNPILGFIFAAVLVPALWAWAKKNCFPAAAKKDPGGDGGGA